MKPGVPARDAAARALGRVLRDGAYSNLVMRGEAAHLGDLDRRFASRLLFGALRRLMPIDDAIADASSRPLDQIQPELLDVLRIAAFEIGEDPDIAYAAVDSAVEVARSVAGRGAAGFVNAVLRRLATAPPATGQPTVPSWMGDRLAGALGEAAAARFLSAADTEPRLGVFTPDEPPAGAEPAAGIPGAYFLATGTAPPDDVLVLDPASVAVANAVEAQPGEVVIDLAAAPGGKTAVLWYAMGGQGLLVAVDRHRGRLARAAGRLGELGMAPAWVAADARTPPLAPGNADRVLLDAPCTGLGTLRRRPEIRHRLDPGAPARMGELQRDLLTAALDLLRPGGRLVYSVCTLFPEETIEVVSDLPARPPEAIPGRVWGKGRLLEPSEVETDGMFVSVLER